MPVNGGPGADRGRLSPRLATARSGFRAEWRDAWHFSQRRHVPRTSGSASARLGVVGRRWDEASATAARPGVRPDSAVYKASASHPMGRVDEDRLLQQALRLDPGYRGPTTSSMPLQRGQHDGAIGTCSRPSASPPSPPATSACPAQRAGSTNHRPLAAGLSIGPSPHVHSTSAGSMAQQGGGCWRRPSTTSGKPSTSTRVRLGPRAASPIPYLAACAPCGPRPAKAPRMGNGEPEGPACAGKRWISCEPAWS